MFFQTTAILLLIYSQFTLSDNSNPCDSTWIYYNKTGCCYKTSTEIGTWFDGSGICARMHTGSHLASLRSADESTFVTKSHRIGLDRIHAWTGLSQTQKTNNWTFTDGSKPWSSFIFPYLLPHNHSSCVELRDDWLLELFNHTGKTQPTFCYLLQKSLCKYCPIPKINQTTPTTTKTPALRIEKTHPRSNQVEPSSGCSSGLVPNQVSSQNSVKTNSNLSVQPNAPTITKQSPTLGIPSAPSVNRTVQLNASRPA